MAEKWATRAECAAHLKTSVDGFDWWAKSRGVQPKGRRGRVPLYRLEDLDRVVKMDATSVSRRLSKPRKSD